MIVNKPKKEKDHIKICSVIYNYGSDIWNNIL